MCPFQLLLYSMVYSLDSYHFIASFAQLLALHVKLRMYSTDNSDKGCAIYLKVAFVIVLYMEAATIGHD